jgi:competence protein ComEC
MKRLVASIKNNTIKIHDYLEQQSERNLYQGWALVLVTISIVFIVLLWGTQNSSEMRVSFIDVGQGDSIFITAPNGRQVLIDGGPDDRVLLGLGRDMKFLDRNIDMVIATHPDKDHIAGLSSVFRLYDIDYIMTSEIQSDTTYDQALHDAISREPDLLQVTARRGERIILDADHGVYLDILFPGSNTELWDETNEASIVVRLVYGKQSFLLNGDSIASVEQYLVDTDGAGLRSTVLKLGHHGSKTSSIEPYLLAVNPQYAVVSAGKNNRYGHPASEVIDRVRAVGANIVSTIDHGTISFLTNGDYLYVDFEK